MAKRKGFGNPLSKALSKVLDEVAPEALDGFMDVATGPKKSDKKGSPLVVDPLDRLGHPGCRPLPASVTDPGGRTVSEGWRRDRRVAEVLDEADVLHVAVSARSGPHVTPTVFDVDGGRLWFVTPRRSVKARVIARRRRVGGLVQLGRRAVMIGGRARIVDPLTARGVFSPGGFLDLPFAAAGYLSRNHRHATGTIRDHKAPTLALSRVLVSIDIRSMALLEGDAVVETWGRWDRSDLLLRGDPPAAGPPDLIAVPPTLRNLLADDAPVVLGWQSLSGPLALPARWQAATGEMETSGEAMVLAAAASGSPACVTAERSRARLNSKHGLLLSGDGHARLDGPAARVTLETRRTTWWMGEERHTIGAPASA